MKTLTRFILVMFLLWSMVCGLWTNSSAAIPHLINYQGRLTDSSGIPLNGSYALTFRIYDAETAGTLLWEETHTGALIQKGIFSLLLGSVTNLDLPFDKPYWLEIKVGNEVMSPRQRIASVGYAYTAEGLDGRKANDLLNRSNHTSTQSPSTISPQGSASGLNSDMVDGKHVGAGADDIPVRSIVSNEIDTDITSHTNAFGHLSIAQKTELTNGALTNLHLHSTVKSLQKGEINLNTSSSADSPYGTKNISISSVVINKSIVIVSGAFTDVAGVIVCSGRLTSNNNLEIKYSADARGWHALITWQVVEFY